MALAILLGAAAPAPPPTAAPAPPTANPVEAQARALGPIGAQAMATNDDARLAGLQARSAAIEASEMHAEAPLRQQLARLARERGRKAAAERSKLTAQVAGIHALTAEAGDTYNQIAEKRRNSFSVRILRRYASPLSPAFWTGLASSGAADFSRFDALADEALGEAWAAPEPAGLVSLALGGLLAALILLPGGWLLRLPARRGVDRTHPLALSATRLWLAIIGVALPTLAAMAVRMGASWGRLLSQRADALAGAVIAAIAWGAAIIALGGALGASRQADRRLLQLTDAEAQRARFWLLFVALVTAAGFLAARMIYLTGASVALSVALNAAQSLAYAAVAVMVLVSFGGGRPSAARGFIALLLSLAVAAILIAVLAGYETLAALIAGQVFWLSLIAGVAWLAARLADDACQAVFQGEGPARNALSSMFGLGESAISQIGVLTSAGLQLVILAAAATLALTPFGQSGALLAANFGRLGAPIRIGQAHVSPIAIAAGLVSLAVGLLVARLVRDWVDRRYLPVTTWDVGLRTSVSTGVGYVGVLIALLCALGVMGLGFHQIIIIAGALSVGIGFGLQQIVQNFVSGLILLVERPVKVGDWVCVDQMEGDIARIRVRATELRMADRTTVLVPNSELITKAVHNRTRLGPGSRVELRLPIDDPREARRALDLMLTAAGKDEGVRDEPPLAAFVDAVAIEGPATLVLIAHLSDPSQRTQIRGRLYLAAIEALAGADIALAGHGPKAD